jgi:hypothetical protein
LRDCASVGNAASNIDGIGILAKGRRLELALGLQLGVPIKIAPEILAHIVRKELEPCPPVRAPAAIARVSGWQSSQAAARFVADSSLERAGFEPSVPLSVLTVSRPPLVISLPLRRAE